MKTYQKLAKRLLELRGDDQAVVITAAGFMPLTIEELGLTAEGNQQISITHYGSQNGDAMRDPEVIFEIYTNDAGYVLAEPIYFRNDYAGLEYWVYNYDENSLKTGFWSRRKRELKSFAELWFRNLRDQGFHSRDAARQVLS